MLYSLCIIMEEVESELQARMLALAVTRAIGHRNWSRQQLRVTLRYLLVEEGGGNRLARVRAWARERGEEFLEQARAAAREALEDEAQLEAVLTARDTQ